MYFNPRPREEGDIYTQSGWGAADYFNPRPREEGDIAHMQAPKSHNISIHALVKRATNLYCVDVKNNLFQSTPS